ncbi:DNA replication/repair protein RecF [Thorsellia anophelis]|uniref:DNA replication and repair protein RecF n=1 Tax=Thorsellia anophelis DSM 18579 TaxID=1123402 RepID=A0A1H9YZH4_9GAMM|nr:DNA replication/repair protein RecF [Thorsellia anophelis]SES74005.1 DNA replication and repair protein RecF [Thorsellia anophelis DSM 18579]
MLIERLTIHKFRNIQEADLSFSSHLNCFVGENGSGKTSLLEAIYTLGHGRAFRTSLTARVINHEAESFILHARLNGVEQESIKVGLLKHRNGDVRVKINEQDGHKIAALAQNLPMQLITPEGFALVDGGPKFRRGFVDWGCFHHFPQFYPKWHAIKRIVKQRNAALKQTYNYAQLSVWDEELVRLTEEVTVIRKTYCERLINIIHSYIKSFLPDHQINIQFYPGWNVNSSYKELLEKQYERDKMMGYTTLGAHKADMRMHIGHLPVESILSRGQLKLLMCALRLAQGHFFTSELERQCVFLIDDFSAELDDERKNKLASALKNQKAQVFITALGSQHLTDFQSYHEESTKHFRVKAGEINELNSF